MEVDFGSDSGSDTDAREFLEDLGFVEEHVVPATDENFRWLLRYFQENGITPVVKHLADDVAVRFGAASCANIFRSMVNAQFQAAFLTGDVRFMEMTRASDNPKWRVVNTVDLFAMQDRVAHIPSFDLLFCFNRDYEVFWATRQDFLVLQ